LPQPPGFSVCQLNFLRYHFFINTCHCSRAHRSGRSEAAGRPPFDPADIGCLGHLCSLLRPGPSVDR
jgi:hypothetical protein